MNVLEWGFNYELLAICELETLQNPVVKIGGWAFSLREFCRVYWVQSRYYDIMELYAPNKSAIYAVLGRYHVLKIVEV